MSAFFLKLISPRPTFPQDITPAEGRLMQAHVEYWRGRIAQGKVVAFGPVADPAATYGIAIIEVADDVEARALTDADPVIRAACGFRYESHPMPRGALHPPFAA